MKETTKFSDQTPLMMDKLKSTLLEGGVDVELLAAVPSTEIYHSSLNSYSLSKRFGTRQLLNSFTKSVKAAQEEYFDAIKNSLRFLFANLEGCKEMDRIIGDGADEVLSTCERTPNSVIMKQKDGTKKLSCPFHKCSVETFRLRRHIKQSHNDLPSSDIDILMKMVIAMAANGDNECVTASKIPLKTKKAKGDERTNLISRKHNWKLCILCETLQLNMTTHLQATHKICRDSDPASYRSYLNDSKVVPKCYLKKVNGRMMMMEEDELKRAKENNEEVIQEQTEVHEKLKDLRKKREDAYKKKSDAITEDDKASSDKIWKEADSQYKALRYGGVRPYSDKLSVWKDSFMAHLTKREYCNPKRMCNMAMDLLLNYEKETGRPIKLDDIFEAKNIKFILNSYKSILKTTATSKLKYLGAFNLFMKFMFLDVDSPECTRSINSTDIMVKDFKFKQIQQEISNLKSILAKSKGADLIVTKEKAKRKIITNEEMQAFLSEVSLSLSTLHTGVIGKGIVVSDLKEQESIRDKLIAVATIRLARRSKELIRLTIEEVEKALKKEVNGIVYHVINVYDHKNSKRGLPATLAYTDTEFHVLKYYIKHVRPIFINNVNTPYVFTRILSSTRSSAELTYVDLFNILKKFKTRSGKTISSRTIRGSAVTHSRIMSTSEENKRDMAVSMGHTMQVQESNYNYEEVSNASLRVLANAASAVDETPSTSVGPALGEIPTLIAYDDDDTLSTSAYDDDTLSTSAYDDDTLSTSAPFHETSSTSAAFHETSSTSAAFHETSSTSAAFHETSSTSAAFHETSSTSAAFHETSSTSAAFHETSSTSAAFHETSSTFPALLGTPSTSAALLGTPSTSAAFHETSSTFSALLGTPSTSAAFNETLISEFTGISSSSTSLTASTPRKRSLSHSELERTLQTLRSKKVKVNGNTEELEREIMIAIKKANCTMEIFLTSKGNVTIKPLRNFLPANIFARFTSAQIKRSLKQSLTKLE